MNYRIWYSTEPFADFIIDHTELKKPTVLMAESNALGVMNSQ